MNTSIDVELEALRRRLAAAFHAVQQQVADAVRALERNDAQLAGEVHLKQSSIAGELGRLERDAVDLAGRSANSDRIAQFAITTVQISAGLRHVDQLADELSRSAKAMIGAHLPVDLADHLRRMAELALLQFTAAQEALAADDPAQATRAWKREVELDSWYDLLLRECFDDVAERGEVPDHLAAMLSTAKLLERISGYSVVLSEEVARALAA